ncbi:MAG: carbohydrate-binding protein, partial [Clostridia bacterium]|nr:carbohydrate-binding protein [Clostridia bacterium]
IEYMTSDSPMGPFEYAGELFVNQGRFFGLYGNNHHSIVEFKGQHYLVYHNRPIEKAMGITGNYRSPQIDKITVNEDGSLAPVRGTMTGINQLHTVNPYEKIPATTIYREAGIEVEGYADKAVLKAVNGSWIQVKGVNIEDGAKTFTMKASSKSGGAVRVALDRTFGDVLCEITIPAGSEGVEFTANCKKVKDVHDLYIIFAGNVEAEWWQIQE